MNLNQLKIFYYAAKNGSLSVAAQALFITQLAVTKGIQRLQEHYEIRFIDFVGKKLVLTDAGEELYKIAEKIFELENQAAENIRDFQQRRRGELSVARFEFRVAGSRWRVYIFSIQNPKSISRHYPGRVL